MALRHRLEIMSMAMFGATSDTWNSDGAGLTTQAREEHEDVVKSRSQSAAVRAKVLVVLTKGGYRKSLRGVAYILHRCQQRSAGWSSAYSNERKSVSQFGR